MVKDKSDTNKEKPSLSDPYVGLRPFERSERSLFFGRDKEAQFLRDKIFSSKLTLLFAGSGVGKSSLLKAVVIPQLEEEHSWVFYFDSWSGERPLDALKSMLICAAMEAGIVSAGAGSPTLIELIRLLSTIDGRTIILVLDQFEEFLIAHDQDIDPVKKEIAAIARAPGLDGRVVLSMREEFLAALEPFRRDVVNLFRTTFRLNTLDDKSVADAIMRPPEIFDGKCDPGVVQRIMEDLRQKDVERIMMTAVQAPIDLPMLQLVCLELWKKAKLKGDRILSPELYKEAGGAREILSAYISRVMPKRWPDAKCVAQLLLHLAPPSGFKISFTIDDLANVTKYESAVIKRQLDKLNEHRILRVRKLHEDNRYELQHDALIAVLSPWRNRIFNYMRIRRAAKWLVGSVFLMAIFAGSLFYIQHWQAEQEFRANTDGLLSALREMPPEQQIRIAEVNFNSATSYVLWRRDEPERYDYLRKLLKKNEDLQPTWYGVNTSGLNNITLPPSNWPFRLYYSDKLNLDPYYFNLVWRDRARFFAENWGVPVPLRIHLESDPTHPRTLFRLDGPDIEPLFIRASVDSAFITQKELPQPAQEFFDRFREEWDRIPQAELGGPWWIVPRWSLPVWNVSGNLATDGSGLPAFLLALELQKHPDRLLSKPAVDLLLERVEELYPETVKEVRAARGDRLPADLAKLVKLGCPLTELPIILDYFAQYPEEKSEVLALFYYFDYYFDLLDIPDRLQGPWSDESNKSKQKTINNIKSTDVTLKSDSGRSQPEVSEETLQAYQSVEEWLPPVEPPIRCYSGQQLVNEWFPNAAWLPEFVESVISMQDKIYRQFGINCPWPKFRMRWELGDREFSILMFDQTAASEDAQPISTTPEKSIDRFIDALAFRAQGLRTYLIDADYVAGQLSILDEELQDWLLAKYSLTDIKILLRHVVYPSDVEIGLYDVAQDGEYISSPPQNSIRHLPWLLGSLVFWFQLDDPLDALSLSRYLRETQQARLESSPDDLPVQSTDKNIRSGLEMLKSQKLQEAQEYFAAALQQNRDKAIDSFLAQYPKLLHESLLQSLKEKCENPTRAYFSREEETYLEDLLMEPPEQMERDIIMRFKLGLFHSLLIDEQPKKKMALLEDLLNELTSDENWDPNETAEFALEVLNECNIFKNQHDIRTRAINLLKRSIQDLDDEKAYAIFYALIEPCFNPGPNRWRRELLKELADLVPYADIQLELAWGLSTYVLLREDLLLAIEFSQLAEKSIRKDTELSPEDREWKLDIILYSRAMAFSNLGWLGDRTALDEAERQLSKFLDSRAVGEFSRLQLAKILNGLGRFDEALSIITELKEPQELADAYNLQMLLIYLSQQDLDAVSVLVDEVLENATDQSAALFVASLAQILTGRGEWEHTARKFLHTDHHYLEFIAMLLYAHMAGQAGTEADLLLQERWARIDPTTWKQRSCEGDELVWQEMLIGYFKGEVPRSDIFAVLEDPDAFAASNLKHLPYSRTGMMCEAYFYDAMLAKANGNRQQMLESLRLTVDTGYGSYIEYSVARFLLAREDKLQDGDD